MQRCFLAPFGMWWTPFKQLSLDLLDSFNRMVWFWSENILMLQMCTLSITMTLSELHCNEPRKINKKNHRRIRDIYKFSPANPMVRFAHVPIQNRCMTHLLPLKEAHCTTCNSFISNLLQLACQLTHNDLSRKGHATHSEHYLKVGSHVDTRIRTCTGICMTHITQLVHSIQQKPCT